MKTIDVICPVYNEEEVIEAFYGRLSTVLKTVSDRYTSTTTFVLDRSPDRTLEILRRISEKDPKVRVLALSSRFGHQMSLLAGMDHSAADALVMLDSDLQHPPELIPKLLAEFEKGNDIVYTIRKDTREAVSLKNLSSKIFYWFINRISKVRIQESAADFRLISRRVVRVFQKQVRERNQFLRGLMGWVGFKQAGVEFEVSPRNAGCSKYSIGRLFNFATKGAVSFSNRPLQVATWVGFGFATFGTILTIITFAQYFYCSQLPSGWTTIVIIISGFSGVNLFFLGIIGQYIGAIFDEVKARPHYIIEEKIGFGEEKDSM